jgi:hypothetical protein
VPAPRWVAVSPRRGARHDRIGSIGTRRSDSAPVPSRPPACSRLPGLREDSSRLQLVGAPLGVGHRSGFPVLVGLEVSMPGLRKIPAPALRAWTSLPFRRFIPGLLLPAFRLILLPLAPLRPNRSSVFLRGPPCRYSWPAAARGAERGPEAAINPLVPCSSQPTIPTPPRGAVRSCCNLRKAAGSVRPCCRRDSTGRFTRSPALRAVGGLSPAGRVATPAFGLVAATFFRVRLRPRLVLCSPPSPGAFREKQA